MKILIPIVIGLLVVGCGEKGERLLPPEPPKVIPEKLIANPIVETEIRYRINKLTGELTEADLEKVKYLDLDGNQLTEVKGLEKLTQLRKLHLARNQLTNVTGLEKLTQLTGLGLGGNQLTDVKGLEKLTNLTDLHLAGNKLTNVTGLEKLTQLTSLILFGNPDLTKAQIEELQKALPKCKIHSNPTK